MIEMLVASVLLASALLTMAWQHALAARYEKMSQFRGLATQLASELADRVRANAAAVNAYDHRVPYEPGSAIGDGGDCLTITCSAAQMARFDLVEFRRSVRASLPDGDLYMQVETPQSLTIWVLWRDPRMLDNKLMSTSLTELCPQEAIAGVSGDDAPQCLALRVLL